MDHSGPLDGPLPYPLDGLRACVSKQMIGGDLFHALATTVWVRGLTQRAESRRVHKECVSVLGLFRVWHYYYRVAIEESTEGSWTSSELSFY